MLMELIEKKGMPVKTRYKFTKKEWSLLSEKIRMNLNEIRELHITQRTVWFDVDGDMINMKHSYFVDGLRKE